VVDPLLDAEDFTRVVLDPACRTGTIVHACWDRSIDATGGDIVNRG
jgi:hypothetical protein